MVLSLALSTCRCRVSFTRATPSLLCPSYQKYNQIKYLHDKSVYKTKEAKRIQFYILNRFLKYLKNYDKILEKNFPTTMKTYRVFVDGIKYFSIDTKEYFKIVMLLNSAGGNYSKLLRREIELYHQMPKDMMKVAPVIIFSALPFAFYILLPLAYAFPKQILTTHFWSTEQKENFGIDYMHNTLIHNKPVFRHLQSQVKFIKYHPKKKIFFEAWNKIVAEIGSGVQPSVDDILSCKELFQDEPYHLSYLSRNHIYHLLKVHGIHIGWFRRTRLADRAQILIEMDKAIMREGGVHNMPLEALKKCCYIRGLNPKFATQEHMIKWLTNWIKISNDIDKNTLSLLLHCPVLLGYNEQSNWCLIYPQK
ncbi:LETM1 domain-containing protein 1 isoform X2 [Anthonomus grandis grandis]|uniref:LETM1 domain-containing protein 1 isoform X2 n=1 Tax=Anthonomus grandis grandis TaxID=2921223 RepID=UPI002165672F|nr:LETM1 domain-containing protein 1 isoform X2 [Anthonomus grandis grandis]